MDGHSFSGYTSACIACYANALVLKYNYKTTCTAVPHHCTGHRCPSSFISIPSVNGCYEVVTRNLSWSNAGRECRLLHPDAHLLVVNDAQEQRAVAGMLASRGQFSFCFHSLFHKALYNLFDFQKPLSGICTFWTF